MISEHDARVLLTYIETLERYIHRGEIQDAYTLTLAIERFLKSLGGDEPK